MGDRPIPLSEPIPPVNGQPVEDAQGLCRRALETLRGRKADGDVYLEHRHSLHLQVRDGRLDELQRAEVRGLGIRALRDGRLGFVHTSQLDPDGVATAALRACTLASASSPNADLSLADPSGPGDGSDEGTALNLYDNEIEARSIAEKQEWCRTAEAAALAADPRVKRSQGVSWNEDLTEIWMANTRGLLRHYRSSHVEIGATVTAEEAGTKQDGDAGLEAVRWQRLPDPAQFGPRAAERAARLLGGRPVETGRYPVVFSPESGWALLVYLATALDGGHLSRGRSWLAPLLEKDPQLALGSPLVSVHDDGRAAGGVASAPFDGEGVSTTSTVLLSQGRVQGRLLDLASGHRLALPSTGNARRGGYEDRPFIRSSNLYLLPGDSPVERLLAPVKKGLWVWGLTGWWIGNDPSNPQFSSAAFGLWIEEGKPTRPVAQVTVAGSLSEILSGIEEIGNDLTLDRSTKTPSFRVKEMSVSGT